MPLKKLFRIIFHQRRTQLPQHDPSSPMGRFLEDGRCSNADEDIWCHLIAEGRNRSCFVRTLCPFNSSMEGTPSGEILKSIQRGNYAALTIALDDISTESLDSIRFAGRNLLHFICFRKDVEALKIVLKKGADPNLMDIDGVCPLHVAVHERWTEGVQELLHFGASSDVLPKPPCVNLGYEVEAPILAAARFGDYPMCASFMDYKLKLQVADKEGNTLLHLAAYSHCLPLLRRLLKNDAFACHSSSINKMKDTPMHCLMSGENLPEAEVEIYDCLQTLINSGAEVNITNSLGKTPLYLAARSGLESVVVALLQAGADPVIVAVNGRTALHAACRAGNHNVLSILLETGRTGKFVLFEDKKQMVPFHIAVLSSSIECCQILLQNGDHLSKVDSAGRKRVDLILKNMPSALHLLRKIFDSYIHVSKKEINDPEFSVKMNFLPLLSSQYQNIQESIMSDLISDDAEPLLKHPLVESFLYLKWHSIKSFFYIHVFFYFLFLLLHSYFITKTYILNSDWDGEEMLLLIITIIHTILLLMLSIPGALYLIANILEYLTQIETYFKSTALLTAAIIMLIQNNNDLSDNVKRNIAAISIFFAWAEFMMLLGRFPSLGVYILMFTRVAKAFIKFLMAFSSLIIAFSFAFGILFSGSSLFPNLSVSFVKTLMMMVGEIEYADLYSHLKEKDGNSIISHFFLVAFLFLVPILMTNLLISLAVNDLGDLHKHGKIRRLVKEASYLVSYERVLLAFINTSCLPTCLIKFYSKKSRIPKVITIYPNQCRSRNKGTAEVSPDALSDAIAIARDSNSSIPERLRHMEDDFETNFKEFLKEYSEDKQRTKDALEKILNIAQTKLGHSKLLRNMKSI